MLMLLSLPCVFGYNIWSDFHPILGKDVLCLLYTSFERENALIREARHFPVPQCDGADPRALAAALPLHPEAPRCV